MDVEQPSEGFGLRFTQRREITRDLLNRAVALAQLHGDLSAADITDCCGVAVLSERISEGEGSDPRVASRRPDDGRVASFDLAGAGYGESFDGFSPADLPEIAERFECEF